MLVFSSVLLSVVGFACVGLAALPLLGAAESVGFIVASDGGKVFDGAATDWLDEPAVFSDTGLGWSVFEVL
jgi:hypothetical protein